MVLLEAAFVFLSSLVITSLGLSYPVCDQIGQEYVTASSSLEGTWPFYSLLFTCTGNLNLEGYEVEACVDKGGQCGQAAANAFCQYLGFDYNAPGLFGLSTASAPALSMTGEWCVSPGSYADLGHPNRTDFEGIRAANVGPYCSSLSSVTCIRSRASLQRSLPGIMESAANAPASPPQLLLSNGQTAAKPITISAGRRFMAA